MDISPDKIRMARYLIGPLSYTRDLVLREIFVPRDAFVGLVGKINPSDTTDSVKFLFSSSRLSLSAWENLAIPWDFE